MKVPSMFKKKRPKSQWSSKDRPSLFVFVSTDSALISGFHRTHLKPSIIRRLDPFTTPILSNKTFSKEKACNFSIERYNWHNPKHYFHTIHSNSYQCITHWRFSWKQSNKTYRSAEKKKEKLESTSSKN